MNIFNHEVYVLWSTIVQCEFIPLFCVFVLNYLKNVMLQPKIRMASTQNASQKSGWMSTSGFITFIVRIYWYAALLISVC